MEALAWIGLAVGVVLLFAAASWLWWLNRARMSDMQRRLTWNEQSRFALERHAQEVDLRLAAMSQALESLEAQRLPSATPMPSVGLPPVLPPGDASERRRLMEETLGRADAAAAVTLAQAGPAHASPWTDTEPMPLGDPCYAPTMPLELRDEERVLPERNTSRRAPVRQ